MRYKARIIFAASALMVVTSTNAALVDLSGWVAEGGGNWTLAPDNNSVTQSLNGDPTVFFGPGNSQGNQLSGQITVNTTSDDDFIGFVLGYNAGDLANIVSDFLLIDWKQADQNFGGFGLATAGLAISRVTSGLDDDAGAWSHDPNFGIEELARGSTLGATGWANQTTYTFDLVFNPSNVQVFVDGNKEIDINGSFENGSFGFYNYSQSNVTYAGIQQTVAPPPAAVPEPATIALFGLGFVGILFRKWRKINGRLA